MKRNRRRRRRGATLVLICLLMLLLVAMVAFALDVGRMYLIRSQLQTAVDSGALAASLRLRQDPDDLEAAVASAEDFVQLNRVGWFVTVPDESIAVEMGTWDAAAGSFSVGGTSPNAVRVRAEALKEPLFFAGVLGHRTVDVPCQAVASGDSHELDIVLTLDLSGSMSDQGRIEALRTAAPAFVDYLASAGSDDRLAVMGYGALRNYSIPKSDGTKYLSTPSYLCSGDPDWVAVMEAPFTADLEGLKSHPLSSTYLQADMYHTWTPTGAALRDSAHYLYSNARTGATKIVVLMSDGLANKPDGHGPEYAREVAAVVGAYGIRVYTISLGSDADLDLMADIAELTGGVHFAATGSSGDIEAELHGAFKDVADAIKQLELVQ